VRVDAKANPEQKALLSKLSPEQVTSTELAGERSRASSAMRRATTRPSAA
jgi:phosphoglucomutase